MKEHVRRRSSKRSPDQRYSARWYFDDRPPLKKEEEEEEGVPIIEAFFKFIGIYFLLGLGFAMIVSNIFRHAGMDEGITAGAIVVVTALTVITGIGIFIGYVIEEDRINKEAEEDSDEWEDD